MSQPSVGYTHTVLVVDDEASILDMLNEIVVDEGFTVHIAANGHEALVRAGETLPDVILTDLMMPLLDGRALLRRLREDPRTARIPGLLMSAAGRPRSDDTFDGFIAKPFSIETLVTHALPKYKGRSATLVAKPFRDKTSWTIFRPCSPNPRSSRPHPS